MSRDNVPFFIVGASRSGTTLLRLIMAGHSRIHIPAETWFVEPLVQQLPLTQALSSAQARQAIDIITSHYRWPDMGIPADEFVKSAEALAEPKLADIVNLVYRRQLEAAGKSRFGDKTPQYIGIVPELAALYPGAKFIHLIRDGRDVAISFIDADFEGRCYDGERFQWIWTIHKGIAYRRSPQASDILEVRYEDLVSNPEPTVRAICKFLGEEFEPAMLQFQERREMVPARGRHIHTKLEQPLSNDATQIWRKKLSGPECFAMEACIRNELALLDYPLRFRGLGWRPLLGLTALVLRGLAPLLDRAIPALQRRGYLSKKMYF